MRAAARGSGTLGCGSSGSRRDEVPFELRELLEPSQHLHPLLKRLDGRGARLVCRQRRVYAEAGGQLAALKLLRLRSAWRRSLGLAQKAP